MGIDSDANDAYFDSKYGVAQERGDFTSRGLPDYKITDRKSVRGKKILNVGCGTAQDTWWLAKDNEVCGLDGSKVGVKIAREHGVKAIRHDITTRFPFKDETFDIVIIKDVLEHMMWPLPLLLECKRVAKPTGKVVINVPNQYTGHARIKMLLGKSVVWYRHIKKNDEWDSPHVRFWTYKGFLKFLRVAGLKPDKFFFDFATLAHYSDPDYLYLMVKDKVNKSWRVKLFLNLLYPGYKVFDSIFPRSLRHAVVSLAPSLMCSHFYCIASKKSAGR